MPSPLTISRMTGPWPCLVLMIAAASPVGVDDGATMPSWVALPVGLMLGTMASAGRSTGPLTGGAVVVVVVSSFGLWSFSDLGGAVVVGAGAAGVAGWVADGTAETGAVVAVVPGVAGAAVVSVVGCVVGVVSGVVVVVGAAPRTWIAPHIPSSLPLESDPSPSTLE